MSMSFIQRQNIVIHFITKVEYSENNEISKTSTYINAFVKFVEMSDSEIELYKKKIEYLKEEESKNNELNNY